MPNHYSRISVVLTAIFAVGAAACGGGSVAPTTPGGSPTQEAADGTILLQTLPIATASLDYAGISRLTAGREPGWLPYDPFGTMVPASSVRPNPMPNPQPTFYAPLGTPVVAVVSGTVTDIFKLYSDDYSVTIDSPRGGGRWEHEHVMDVRVTVGTHVTAGQQIGSVSDYECSWGRQGNPSDPLCQSHLGLVELGLLYGGNPPTHRCPFDPAVVMPDRQAAIFAALDTIRARIKSAVGNPAVFGEASWASPECVTLARVQG